MMKKKRRFCVWKVILSSTFLIILNLHAAKEIFAFNSGYTLGSSIVIPNYQVYIDGNAVTKPNTEVIIGTDKPTFFGYTVSSSIIKILVQPNGIKSSTITDKNGYWVYSLNKSLPPGDYKVYLSVMDRTGASSSAVLAGTFQIPSVMGSSVRKIIVPAPSLKKLDYLTVSLIIFSTTLALIFFYLLAKKQEHVDE